MTYAVISDVHANLNALESVLAEIKGRDIKTIYFLGDAVGYGPEPNECVRALAGQCKVLIAGNHDWGALGLTDISYFNLYARQALEWTGSVLTPESRAAMEGFQLIKRLKREDAFLVHGTPREPEEWHYLITRTDAEENFAFFEEKFCFLGHSHLPFIVEKKATGEMVSCGDEALIAPGSRYIINTGSVGQPRDGDPRACYLLMEAGRASLVRVRYDIARTQEKMALAGLPRPLIERLSRGR